MANKTANTGSNRTNTFYVLLTVILFRKNTENCKTAGGTNE